MEVVATRPKKTGGSGRVKRRTLSERAWMPREVR